MLHWNAVSPELKRLLHFIAEKEAFHSFRLCGGTALALQLGHRTSVDADYVSEKEFDKQHLVQIITKTIPDVSDLLIGEFGIFLKSNNVKLDFLSWNIPFIRRAVIHDKIQMVNVEEIGAMKLFAITRRGEKKDYYDIAFLLRHYTLAQLLQFYHERHPKNDVLIVARFLTGFSDIDFQPEPAKLVDFSWEDAKVLLQNSVKEYFQSK